MNPSAALLGVVVAMLHILSTAKCADNTIQPATLRDMLTKNICICPCGNPRGGKKYDIPNEVLNWFDAAAYCSTRGMSIVAIENEEEHEQLRKYLISTRYNRATQFWIGANSLSEKLRWGLSEREVHNPRWAPPMRYAPVISNPNCVSMNGYTMQWERADCENMQNQFICEY